MNRTYVCYTFYHLYISILDSNYFKQNNPNCVIGIVLTDHIKDHVFFGEKIIMFDWIDTIMYVNDKQLNGILNKSLLQKNNFLNYKKVLYSLYDSMLTSDQKLLFANSKIIIFLDRTSLSRYLLLKYKDLNLYEDGIGLYKKQVRGMKYFIKRYLLNLPLEDGRDGSIEAIYATHPEKVPVDIRNKAICLDLQQMEDEFENSKREELIKIFLGDNIFEKLKNREKKALLITQPFSEDGCMHMPRQVHMYREIIKDLNFDYEIYIKPHPRERTDYLTDFPNCNIIPSQFPLELINLTNDVYFDVGVTVSSTALKNIGFVGEKRYMDSKVRELLKASTQDI